MQMPRNTLSWNCLSTKCFSLWEKECELPVLLLSMQKTTWQQNAWSTLFCPCVSVRAEYRLLVHPGWGLLASSFEVKTPLGRGVSACVSLDWQEVPAREKIYWNPSSVFCQANKRSISHFSHVAPFAFGLISDAQKHLRSMRWGYVVCDSIHTL